MRHRCSLATSLLAAAAFPAVARAQSTDLPPVAIAPAERGLAPLTVESRGASVVLYFGPGEAQVAVTPDPRLTAGQCATPCAVRVVPGTVHIVAQSPWSADLAVAVDVPPQGVRAVLLPEGRAHRTTRRVFALGGAVTALTGLILTFGGLGFVAGCRSSATQNCGDLYWEYAGGPGLGMFAGGLLAAAVGIVMRGFAPEVEIHPPTFVWDAMPVPGGAMATATLRF